MSDPFLQAVRKAPYPLEAFLFVQRGLSWTTDTTGQSNAPENNSSRHISGQHLAEGLRDYAKAQYGAMAQAVLNHWNIQSTLDFGHIVYAMIDTGLMSRTESDCLEDFHDVYPFDTAFPTEFNLDSNATGINP